MDHIRTIRLAIALFALIIGCNTLGGCGSTRVGASGDDADASSIADSQAGDATADLGPGDATADLGPGDGTADLEGDATPLVTMRVGPTRAIKTPSAAAKLAVDGEVIEIDAGLYPGDVAVFTQNNLTLRGVGGFAHLRADGKNAQGKAIWVIQGDDVTLEWIEFSGATVPDQNGAGIRQEGTNLTVRHCYFHDNEDGILAGDNVDSEILIEYSEFARNGFGDGKSHNLYINHVKRLTFQFNYSHHAKIGHNLKSRAYENVIQYNRIMDEGDGTSSYAIDLPNGGTAIILGNLIQQGAQTDNSTMVSFGAEGLSNPLQALYVVHNTLVNDRPSGGNFLFVKTPLGTVQIVNNIFMGPGNLPSDSSFTLAGNISGADVGLVSPETFDYSLSETSPAIDKGAPVPLAGSTTLTPLWHYVHPTSRAPRPTDGKLDIGALERP
ncbi:MAG: right-handed parallel beta-helix repeat-containing protein [Myxococcales bacterium]|nr:right-handed parallel beta-helix repeat-containing protein [Myxococcales bacterium]